MLTVGVFLASCSSTQNTQLTKTTDSSVPGYWQQHVDYTMDVDMNVDNYQYTGKQKLVYTNNSPETLDRVYYHLFFNAFQPGSQIPIGTLKKVIFNQLTGQQSVRLGKIRQQAHSRTGLPTTVTKYCNQHRGGTATDVTLINPR